MATLIPASSSNVEAAYEDMFKEITRKLYGEETGNGLHTLGTPVAQVATTGPTAPEGERSFTNLQINRSAAPTIEYEHNSGAIVATTGGNGNATSSSSSSSSAVSARTTAAAAAAAAAVAANVIQQQQQQQQQQPEGNSVVVVPTTCGNNFIKTEDQLSTAFGLAALMQNGFATTSTILSTQALNKVVANATGQQQQQQQQTINEQQQARWSNNNNNNNTSTAVAEQQQQQQPTQIVQWTTNSGGKLQSYSTTQQQQQQPTQSQQQNVIHTPKSKSKNRPEHGTTSVINSTEMLYASPSTTVLVAPSSSTPNSANTTPNTSAGSSSTSSNATTSSSGGSSRSKKSNQQQANNTNSNNGGGVPVVKRYACTHCPYSTDRRDLYTRHENIHKDEKPFQCYACLKQFNRADHVKKHFLRMHREMQYDINKTRRHVPSSSSSSSNGAIHHTGGRGNVTIPAAAGIHLDDAFLEAQRQPTSSSLSIAETIEAVATAADDPLPQLKQEKNDDGSLVSSNGVGVLVSVGSAASLPASNGIAGNIKPKREKRFTCCYCPWSGADKWGLKRHLNTHTKPFVCLLCEYKAARSERLATHVLKVHNKRACNKCSFLADTQEEYQAHVNEVHPNEVNRPSARQNNTSNNTNNNRNNNNNNNTQNTTTANVLRTIGNTLVANNNQLNTFQNSNTNFGVGNTTTTTTTNAIGNAGGGSVTIYTTTTTNDTNGGVTTNIITGNGTGSGGSGGGGGGPLQEIIVNPSSMVGWRLSANGSLIPPHDLLTGALPTAAAQKRGSERLFQYLEADGSDTEDYARLLKMDAISRNTASVAQDFHKAGGVHELKIPANHQLMFNNKLPSQWTTREAAALLHSLSNMHNNNNNSNHNATTQQQRSKYQSQHNNNKRQRQHSVGDDENTPSSSASSVTSHDGISPMKATTTIDRKFKMHATEQPLYQSNEQRRAMQAFLGKNFDLQEAAMNELQLLAAATTTAAATASNLNNNNKHSSNNNKRKHSNNNNNSKHDDIDEENQENQEQLILTSPAYNKKTNNNNNNNTSNTNHNNQKRHHNNNSNREHRNNTSQLQQRLEQRQTSLNSLANDNKENNQVPTTTTGALPLPLALSLGIPTTPTAAAVSTPTAAGTFLTQMEYQNLNKIGTQFQNYVKDIINKYYAETPLMFPAMPTATTTPQQSQQPLYDELTAKKTNSSSTTELKRKRMLSETEEYIEYLKNKEDITLTITPKQPAAGGARKVPPVSPRRRQQDLSLIKRASPKRSAANVAAYEVPTTAPVKPRKSLTQIATLLPLLADAACQQQYLAAPLDFSKKAEPQTKSVTAVSTAITETAASSGASAPAAELSDSNAAAAAAAAFDKRSSRKQAQPKKIRTPPEVVIAMLRDKYLNLMVNHKLRCNICRNNSKQLVFHYHSKATLALHRLWKHGKVQQTCKQCGSTFAKRHSLGVHLRRMHGERAAS